MLYSNADAADVEMSGNGESHVRPAVDRQLDSYAFVR